MGGFARRAARTGRPVTTMAKSGLVIVSLLIMVCDRSYTADQRNARILRRETLPDGSIQVTVPREDAVMINGVLSAVVPTYQCVRTVQNGLYRQQLTYPCKPRVIIANQSSGVVASTRAPIRTRSVQDSTTPVNLVSLVTSKNQSDQDAATGGVTATTSSSIFNLSSTARKPTDLLNASHADDDSSGTLLTNSFTTNNATKPRGCRFSCRHSTTISPTVQLPSPTAVPAASQASTSTKESTPVPTQSKRGKRTTSAPRVTKEPGRTIPTAPDTKKPGPTTPMVRVTKAAGPTTQTANFPGHLTTGSNSTIAAFGKGTESAISRSASSGLKQGNTTQITTSTPGAESVSKDSLRNSSRANISTSSSPGSLSSTSL